MLSQEEAFFRELLSMYKIEAEEHLKAISSGLIDYEKTEDPAKRKQIIETVYREAHSLKGASRAVNLDSIETVCQSMETVFAFLKREEIEPTPELFDLLLQGADGIEQYIDEPTKDLSDIVHKLQAIEEAHKGEEAPSIDNGEAEEEDSESLEGLLPPPTPKFAKPKEAGAPSENAIKSEPLKKDTKAQEKKAPASQKLPEKPSSIPIEVQKSLVSDTIRISTAKLDSLLLQAEEMLSAKLTAEQHAIDLRKTGNEIDQWKKQWDTLDSEISSIRHKLESKEKKAQLGEYGILFDFLLWNLDQLKNFENHISELQRTAHFNARLLGGMVNNLLEDMKQVLMLPFSTLLKILPKVVRDISRDQGKDVELIVRGSTIEIDRRILEELKDPFIHILRNCIDHGLEKAEERKKFGKSGTGTITISISQQSASKVEILIEDDGRGIDPEKVRAVAVKKGILSDTEAETLTEDECRMLIFQSDVSTSPIITDISGRGLGLPIVREKVEKLGGSLTLESIVGKGTTFRIVLPVTMATFRGIIVEVGGKSFVVPTVNVERVLRLNLEEVKTVENRETIALDGEAVALVHLGDVLNVEKDSPIIQENFCPALLLESGDKRIIFLVDRIQNEQEVLVKNLGKQLARVRNIAGATILGSGKVIVILNVADLIKSAAKLTTHSRRSSKTEDAKLEKKSILVAEDSITSRTLLKNILESAGYHVKTTVDGVDALTAARAESFDLVVSDIEMPRMNGFDLVANIRADKRTAELPVVLVTALESREDRERGIDVGANAYIVKRSFDQSNLLEVIRKLI